MEPFLGVNMEPSGLKRSLTRSLAVGGYLRPGLMLEFCW